MKCKIIRNPNGGYQAQFQSTLLWIFKVWRTLGYTQTYRDGSDYFTPYNFGTKEEARQAVFDYVAKMMRQARRPKPVPEVVEQFDFIL